MSSILSRYGSLRVVTVRHGDRRAAVAIGARSVTLWVGCGSHEGFERKSPLCALHQRARRRARAPRAHVPRARARAHAIFSTSATGLLYNTTQRTTTSSTCSRRSSPRPPPSTRPTPRRSSSHAPRSPASPTSARVRTLGTPVGPSPAADGRRLAAAQPARDARCAHAPRPTATPNPVPADSSTVHPIRLSLHSQSAQIRIVISEAPHSV